MTAIHLQRGIPPRRSEASSNYEVLDTAHDSSLLERMATDRYWPLPAFDAMKLSAQLDSGCQIRSQLLQLIR